MLLVLFKILIFPGLIFLGIYGLLLEFLDRKFYALMQNRVGPPWYQPLADILKLIGKQSIIPQNANQGMFKTLPVIALAAASAAFIYVPVFGGKASFYFEGDLIIMLYLLTIPTICIFLAGWYSRGIFATIGSTRVLTAMFAYEVPLFMALLAPALIADTWSITGMTAYYSQHPLYILINIPALIVALITVQGKLERVPFDTPEAETELASGAFVEYGGKLLAIFKMTKDSEMVVLTSLISAIYLPFMTGNILFDFVLYIMKTLFMLLLLSILRAIVARVRMDQMVSFCWKYLTPIAAIQIIINLIVRGGMTL